jgi:hypothetical protein
MSIFCQLAIVAFHSYTTMSIFCQLAIAGFHSYMKIMSIFYRPAIFAFYSYIRIMPIVCTLATVQSRYIRDASKYLLFIRGLKSDFEVTENLASIHTASSKSAEGHAVSYASVSQPLGRGPVPGPGINYTGPREILLEFIILVF